MEGLRGDRIHYQVVILSTDFCLFNSIFISLDSSEVLSHFANKKHISHLTLQQKVLRLWCDSADLTTVCDPHKAPN